MRSGFRLRDLSLRARLMLTLVALAAVGLAALDVVSYRALDSYLIDRVDQQLEAAVLPVGQSLVRTAISHESLGLGAGGEFPSLGAEAVGTQPAQVPPGTFGQLRRADGSVALSILFGYDEPGRPRPDLPARLTLSEYHGVARPFTASQVGGGSGYRALAVRGPGSLTTIVALPLGDTEATLDRLQVIELIVSVVILAALAGLAWWLVGVGLRPLRQIGEVAGEIAAGDLSQRVETTNPSTEVGRLGISLNAMLSQIEGAFAEREASEARLRQFLADASHELRTPLTSIRGYAELHRMGANREPAQVERSMERIEAEADRMGDLVDDLLTLARVDEVREPDRERVELGALLADARDDAGAAAPDREISLTAGGPLAVVADESQLRRVFANLLRNAVVHTPAGTPIEIGLAREGGEAVVRVRDHGPGLPPGDRGAVFERFWRSSASRGRDDGGAGLGLAIVAAVAAAHGGSAEAADAPGGGAVFTVRLPTSG